MWECDRCSRTTDRPVQVTFETPSRGVLSGRTWLAGALLCTACAAELAEQAGVSEAGRGRIWRPPT